MYVCKAALLFSPCCSGVDDVFVFISTFRQASHLRQPQQRMIYTIKTAGRATFLTSFTTAAAYAANTFSQVITAEKCKWDLYREYLHDGRIEMPLSAYSVFIR